MTVSAAYPPVVWACPTGTVSRLSYSNYESMSVVISGAAPLTLTFTEFDTEQGYVSVYSCSTATCADGATSLLQYSGHTLPSPVTSSTGFILIQWYTGGSTAAQGWRAAWTSPVSGQCACSELLGRRL